jgi:dihydrodipicolinate synthase/N-acetylneuraminate lyase
LRTDWKGIIPALSTATNDRGEIDEASMRHLVRFNIEKGAHGLAVLIGAGEFYKFSDMERMRVAEIVVDEARAYDKIPVLVGISHSGTEPTLMHGRNAKDIGADGVIVMPSYFMREESTTSLYDHYSTIAQKLDLPIMIQDGEAWIGVHMCPTFFQRLIEEYSNIVSIKIEGVGSLEKIKTVKKLIGDDIPIFGGWAAYNMLQELDIGACGNVPDSCMTDLLVNIYDDYMQGNKKRAAKIFAKYGLWIEFLLKYVRSSAEVEKETLRLRGVIKSSYTRFPKVTLNRKSKLELKGILKDMALI